ncbi:MAG TPA: transposase [Pararobbsia sp.]|nr:transposase [Pararobbsia sp.]
MTNLSDAQWSCIEHLFDDPRPSSKAGRPPANARAILNAIRWIQHTRERWIHLPAHYPPQQTCYIKFLAWKKSGLLSEVERILGGCCPPGDGALKASCDD